MDGCTVFGSLLMVAGATLAGIGLGGYLAMCREHKKFKATAQAALDGQDAFWADFNARLKALGLAAPLPSAGGER